MNWHRMEFLPTYLLFTRKEIMSVVLEIGLKRSDINKFFNSCLVPETEISIINDSGISIFPGDLSDRSGGIERASMILGFPGDDRMPERDNNIIEILVSSLNSMTLYHKYQNGEEIP